MLKDYIRPKHQHHNTNIISRRMANNTPTPKVDSIQEKYLSESCIEVNELDEPIGPISKKECHMNPILHRAFSVFIFDKNQRMLLQKRSATKITFPEVWTNSCCSHPLYPSENDKVDGIKSAARRKLLHELGIEKTGEMHLMGRFIYQARSDPVWVEHELDYAICVPNYDSPFSPNPEEVCEVRFVSKDELEEMFKDPENKFSPWFSLFYKLKWLNSWWERLDDLNSLKDFENIVKLS